MVDDQRLIEAMAKHLPPSGSVLRLVDVLGRAAPVLSRLRPDIEVIYTPQKNAGWRIAANTADAVVAYNQHPSADLLKSALRVLRPGGRFVVMNAELAPSQEYVTSLETANFTRILVESGIEEPSPYGALIRGEKPHTEPRTIERIKQVTAQEAQPRPSRYVHLLIHQTPHKPAWRMTPDDKIVWQAVAVAGDNETVLLTFSSLPKAVEFMQFAVMAGYLTNVNKIAKFKWDVVKLWSQPTILNPSDEIFATQAVVMVDIDYATAETPDE